MSDGAALNRTRILARLAVTGLVGIWLSGCSSDSTRLSDAFSTPFANPFSSASNDAAPAQNLASAKPGADVAAGHTSPVAVAALPPATSAGAIKNSAIQTASSDGWRATGGSPIIVADGDTADTLSRRYGVPAAALLHVNGFNSASDVHAGTRLIIPVYDGGAKTADASSAVSYTHLTLPTILRV